MRTRRCGGLVQTLRGENVLFTGTVTVDGEHLYRDHCHRRVVDHGGQWAADWSRAVTVLVHGDLTTNVIDPDRGYGKKLVRAERRMAEEDIHIHVIDAQGFEALLHRRPARCHRLRRRNGTIHAEAIAVDPHFGDLLTLHRETVHDTGASGLEVDLSALDAGTAAHERTVGVLRDHLNDRGIQVFGPAAGAPRFDAGWDDADGRVIAEVKSLSEANEAQQIRLGLGQVLEYACIVSLRRPARGVLVLEREPQGKHWSAVAESAGVQIAWAPAFEGL
ncbi:MAG TPA: hypothetical protein VIS06_22095 [Mycobacteriales bacterium]